MHSVSESTSSRRRAPFLAATAVLLILAAPSVGWAQAQKDTKSKNRAPKGVVTLDNVTITGKVQRPLAAIDVDKVPAAMTLSELKQPFLKRVEAAVFKEPF